MKETNLVVESTSKQAKGKNESRGRIDLETKNPRYILKLSCGLSVELVHDEKRDLAIGIWSAPPTWELMPTILHEYPKWRDSVLRTWAQRRKKNLVVESTSKIPVIAFAAASISNMMSAIN
jgi:hypothetical protein